MFHVRILSHRGAIGKRLASVCLIFGRGGGIIQADLLACKGKFAPYFNTTACFREKTQAAEAARQRLAFDAGQCYNIATEKRI
ncbi:MAG: hypothetical protein HFK08_00120 [Clostridia bacterium]|jgi:hypothetical protein|nr:hypothetical protein [Clostridia bacterium]